MTTVTQALIETFQKGVALTPKDAFYILQNKGIRTTYKSVSKIVSRLYYRGLLDRSGGRYIFSPRGRHSVSNRATQGDTLKVEGDTQKVQSKTTSPSTAVSFPKKVKRNGIRSKLMKRFMAILMNNNIEFFDSDKLYDSLKYKYNFHLQRSTYRVILFRLKKRGYLVFRYGVYHANVQAIREFFHVSNTGLTTPGVPKSLVQSELPMYGGTLSPVSIRVSEHAPRVDIQIGSYLAKEVIKKYNLKPISKKDPSGKVRFKGRHMDAIITKNGYVMITPSSSLWINEVREVFGEGAAAQAKINNAMKHKEYALDDIIKLYKAERFGSQIDNSEFKGGDIGFQGDAEKVEVADEIFKHEIMSKAARSAYLADIIVDLDRTAGELKDLLKNTRDEVMAQVFLNAQTVGAIRKSAAEIRNVMLQFIDIIKNAQNSNSFSGDVEGYA